MPEHITDDEYQRLIAQDNSDEDGSDPWHRLGPYGRKGEPFVPHSPEFEKPIRRRLVISSPAFVETRRRCCLTCHHPLPCNCDV